MQSGSCILPDCVYFIYKDNEKNIIRILHYILSLQYFFLHDVII